MSDYSGDAASALIDVTDAGTAITFSLPTAGTNDPTTDTWTSTSTTTVAGFAIEDKPNHDVYESLSLKQSSARTLFFTPTTAGQLPLVGYVTTWGATTYMVKDIEALAPNGTAIVATIIVSE